MNGTFRNRLTEAFAKWQIGYIAPDMLMGDLSGGEKTRVFLAGQDIFKPSIVLMDEPTNHLDTTGRALVYEDIAAKTVPPSLSAMTERY